MTRSVKLAVLGAGLIGKRHIDHVRAEPEAELMAIVDPSPTGKALAEKLGVGWAPSFSALIKTDRPDGIIDCNAEPSPRRQCVIRLRTQTPSLARPKLLSGLRFLLRLRGSRSAPTETPLLSAFVSNDQQVEPVLIVVNVSDLIQTRT